MIGKFWNIFKNIHYLWHIIFAVIIRFCFISYGLYHDQYASVAYTDVDYKVFTDASRHVLNYGSPYSRNTYRYSPLIAFFLIPNITLHHAFGKVLFSFTDVIVGLLIRAIVLHSLKLYNGHKQKHESKAPQVAGETLKVEYLNKPNIKNIRYRKKSKRLEGQLITTCKTESEVQADTSMLLWLYNPLSIAIATRGNCDSIAGALVLLTLYCLQCKQKYFLAGLCHGLSVHFRLYPLMYSLAFYMHLSKYSYYATNNLFNYTEPKSKKQKDAKNADNQIVETRKTIFKKQYLMYLVPNTNQLRLVFGCLTSLVVLTSLFYYLYGYKFLYETYIYHLVRKDTRHNFSLFFYLQYLTAGVKNIGMWQSVLIVLPQLILLIVFSIRYGLNKFTLNFAIVTITITMVAYNTVLTSQYFIWILVVLPLCIWQIKITAGVALFIMGIWFAAQAAWLVPAYFLEFQGKNTFLFVWLQSVSFFCANIAILGRLIMNFMSFRKVKM
ncbi:PREDICTED: GPI mannosyltransferase 1 [Nicrophorus vespilloides]|uniref:GPI alpha-1,4-mannosyltransferase I, catalytic subunit n=1 Tax=Nicrophorus vespilloides TaxID=110193 RepID=A0ABM1MTZ5_NICVS|nr:PREDICTED: GPI mannosyltransferase 1 [Nicrophorus vespilloides]